MCQIDESWIFQDKFQWCSRKFHCDIIEKDFQSKFKRPNCVGYHCADKWSAAFSCTVRWQKIQVLWHFIKPHFAQFDQRQSLQQFHQTALHEKFQQLTRWERHIWQGHIKVKYLNQVKCILIKNKLDYEYIVHHWRSVLIRLILY